MNRATWWFDADKPGHFIWFAGIVLAANAMMWVLLGPTNVERYSSRKPIVILEVVPHQKTITLGQPYMMTVLFEKTRADCINGKLVRHMWEVEHGWAYKVEEIDTIVADPGVAKITRPIPTHPLQEEDKSFMKEGFWSLKTKITYDCPTPPDGELVRRETVFSSPVFEVGAP